MIMMHSVCLESGIDYLTAVTVERNSTSLMLSRAELVARDEARAGNEVKGWGMSGYSGFKVGQIQFGSRGHEGIVRLSGKLANDEWLDFYNASDRITRIDVQETFRVDCNVTRLIVNNYHKVRKWAMAHQRNLSVKVITSADGGATLYIGSRASETCGRMYNKAVESGLAFYENCVRYEGEFKQHAARSISATLCNSNSEATDIRRMLVPIFCDRLCSFPSGPVDPLLPRSCSARPTDAARRYEWLSQSIAPSIRFVLDNLGPCALRRALKLTDKDLREMLECGPSEDELIG